MKDESHTLNLRSALREAIAVLELEHVAAAPFTAEVLLMHVVGKDRAWLYAHLDDQWNNASRERYVTFISQRASGTPTQYLTGHQEFWGLDFEVTPAVLIPRPETEHLIEVALERLGVTPGHNGARNAKLRIADVGTGSGCIAIALAHELRGAAIVATDISAAALEAARRNAARHNVASRIEFVECNLLDSFLPGTSPMPADRAPLFDLVVSNPPYIGLNDAATLSKEVREHEPHAALFAGQTGTELYGSLIEQAATVSKPGGLLILELGYNSAEHVAKLLDSPAWNDQAITRDLAGIARVASGRRAA